MRTAASVRAARGVGYSPRRVICVAISARRAQPALRRDERLEGVGLVAYWRAKNR
jgi:hypothetical protein